jgi:hypothetical protein
MSKTQLQPDNIKDWDLSGGGGFTLSALEFSQDIQEQLNEVKRILAARGYAIRRYAIRRYAIR